LDANRRVDCGGILCAQEYSKLGEAVRVLLLEVPPLLRGILEHTIKCDPECELENQVLGGVLQGVEEEPKPDMVILGLTAASDVTLVPAIFARWPQAQIMTVMQTGHEAALYELHPRRRALGEISPAQMLERLRTAVKEGRKSSMT
jgi:hypothetical protein